MSPLNVVSPDRVPFVLLACVAGLLGIAVLIAQPRNRVAATFVVVAAALAVAAAPLPAAFLPALWVAGSLVAVLALDIPDGRLVTRRWRIAAVVALAGVVLPAVALALLPIVDGDPTRPVVDVLRATTPAFTPTTAVTAVGAVGVGCALVALFAGLGAVLLRWTRAPGADRTLLRLMVLAIATVALGYLLGRARVPAAYLAAAAIVTLVVVGVTIRDRHQGAPRIVERSAAWTAAAVITLGTALLASAVTPGLAGIAPVTITAIVLLTAVLAEPVRNLVLRGLRGAPAAGVVPAPTDVETTLRSSARTIAGVLDLGYLAIDVTDEHGVAHHAECGTPHERAVHVTVEHRGQVVGTVTAAARGRRPELDELRTAQLLVLGGAAAVTARADDLADSLQGARELLVHAREEERLRLRRDLASVSPALTGTQLLARSLLRGTQPEDRTKLEQLEEFASSSLAEVSRVVEGLRPAELDGGLMPAIRAEVARLTPDGPPVAIDADAPADMPAAVEVCLLRTTAAAVTAARLADASVCRVRLHPSGAGVALTVIDDGQAHDAAAEVVGLRVAVEELRGRCSLTARDGGGARLDVWLPLRRTTPAGTVPGQRESSPTPEMA